MSVVSDLRQLPKPVWILFGGTFINRFGSFVMPFIAIYLTRRGFRPAEAGLAVSAYGAGHFCASMLGGHLADAIGRRHTIALSMFCSAAAMIALSQAQGYVAILVFTFAAGMAAELYRPAAAALIGDLVPQERRVTAYAMYRFAINLGFAVGPATAGFLADRSFFYVFAGDALTSLLYGVVAMIALPHGIRGQTEDESAATGFLVALRDRRFVPFLIATACVTWVEFQIHSTYPLYLSQLGYRTSLYGALLSINGTMIVLFELALTSWTQRRDARRTIALGYFLACAGFAVTGLARSVPALAATVMIWTLGEMVYAPVTGAYVTNLAPERYRGRYHGIWVMMWSFGMVLGPSLGTVIYQRSPLVLWLVCGALGAAAAGLALLRPRADYNPPP